MASFTFVIAFVRLCFATSMDMASTDEESFLQVFSNISITPDMPEELPYYAQSPKKPVIRWTVYPDANVTASFMFCCEEHNLVKNMVTTLRALKYCFQDLLVVVDVPHDRPGGYDAFMHDQKSLDLLATVHKYAQQGVELLQRQCTHSPVTPTYLVKVLDYDASEMRGALMTRFGTGNISCVTPEDLTSESIRDANLTRYTESHPNDFLFDKMYKNTMAYDTILRYARGAYVFHTDSTNTFCEQQAESTDLVYPGRRIQQLIQLMRKDTKVYSTSFWNCADGWPIYDTSYLEEISADNGDEQYETFVTSAEDEDIPWPNSVGLATFCTEMFTCGDASYDVVNPMYIFFDKWRYDSIYPLERWIEPISYLWSSGLGSLLGQARSLKVCLPPAVQVLNSQYAAEKCVRSGFHGN